MMMAKDSLSVNFLSERYRTEWNWVEYRVALTNVSAKTISNPVIQYFAENTNIQYCEKNMNKPDCSGMKIGNYGLDTMLRVSVDFVSKSYQVDTAIISVGKYTVVKLEVKGMLQPGKSVKLHFRLHRDDWKAWDCSRDYSYQKNAAVKEKNSFMVVYDGNHNILWGYNPLDGSNRTGNVVWSSRNKLQVIEKFKDGDDKVIPQGRFWILKDSVFTKNEKDSLKAKGVDVVEVSTYLGQTLLFSKASVPISAKTLRKQLLGFYNAFTVDDTTSLSLILGNDDLYEAKRVCQENGSCEEIVEEKLSYKMEVICWPDVGMFACKDIVKMCGGADALIDRQVVLATISRDSVQCLSRNKNVRTLETEKVGEPDGACALGKYRIDEVMNVNESVYEAMNLAVLQRSPAWQTALKEDKKTTNWLSGDDYKYTGEGIIVGVYDSGIDFEHPAFREYDVEKKKYVPRVSPWYNDENKKYDSEHISAGNDHGTRVAGIIGGNGGGSPNSMFRGIAPKVSFYSYDAVRSHQYGQVVNHSTGFLEDDLTCLDLETCRNTSYYGEKNRKVDENIFKNWSLFTEGGDYLTKTIVQSAGNNGKDAATAGYSRGFHSTKEFKNTITVGAISTWNNTVAEFSSLGPTWDGRIKPDLMAQGERSGFISATTIGTTGNGTIKGYDYAFMCGTSAAAPFVSGVVALMYQKFNEKTGESLDVLSMRNSTTKAMLIHSAVDMNDQNPLDGNPLYKSLNIIDVNKTMNDGDARVFYKKGPDFITGWGSVNAKGALDIIEGYDATTQKFDRFREFEIYNGMTKRWTFNVPTDARVKKARITLVWDDAVPSIEAVSVDKFKKPKLVNDLDMYLVSPSGKPFYPWKLDPLPTEALDEDGKVSKDQGLLTRTSGLEKITLEQANEAAYQYCKDPEDSYTCFDHLNNVEVVDVEGETPDANIETGDWQVVVEGYKVKVGNSTDGFAQVASIVSDFKLEEPTCFKDEHPYLKNRSSSCVHLLGDYLENYVTFDSRTYVAPGDWIYLYDSADKLIGAFTGSGLAGKTVTVGTNTLKVVLESNDDNQQGWGYAIDKVEHMPYEVLYPLLNDVRRKKK